MANEGGEPPTASVQAFINQQARSILVQKAAEVGGEDFKAHCGEKPQLSQEVARYIFDKGLIGKIDSDRVRTPSQFIVEFDFGRDACQCCGRGVGLGKPAWRQAGVALRRFAAPFPGPEVSERAAELLGGAASSASSPRDPPPDELAAMLERFKLRGGDVSALLAKAGVAPGQS